MWDFVDQSNRPSLTLTFSNNSISYFRFSFIQSAVNKSQKNCFMSYGDNTDGTFYLFEVPLNLRNPQENEEETVKAFWNREIEKCDFVAKRRVTMAEEFQTAQRVADIAKAKADALKETAEDAAVELEEKEEAAYQEMLLATQAKLGLISEQ